MNSVLSVCMRTRVQMLSIRGKQSEEHAFVNAVLGAGRAHALLCLRRQLGSHIYMCKWTLEAS